jgi:hypothetical protein
MTNKDKTGNERQKRRRLKEKEWLKRYDYASWEKLHTDLMNGRVVIVNPAEKTDGNNHNPKP